MLWLFRCCLCVASFSCIDCLMVADWYTAVFYFTVSINLCTSEAEPTSTEHLLQHEYAQGLLIYAYARVREFSHVCIRIRIYILILYSSLARAL